MTTSWRSSLLLVGTLVGSTLVAARYASAEGFVEAGPACIADRRCLSIQLHVAQTPHEGQPIAVVTPAWIAAQVTVANAHFAGVGASFRIVGVDANSIPHVISHDDRIALGAWVSPGMIHVFVTGVLDDVDADANQPQEIRGVTLRKGAGKYIILSAKAPDRVLTHELGHLFGLPHSRAPGSLMNKTPRRVPPIEERTFVPSEVNKIKAGLARLLANQQLTL
jgi:hypothetical protein